MIRNDTRLVDHGNERARSDLLDIATAAIESVHPRRTVPDILERQGSTLRAGNREFDLEAVENVYVIGSGKGSAAVVEVVLEILGEYTTAGMVAEKRGQERTLDRVTMLGAGHPLPDETSLEAGRKALEMADGADFGDLVFACITGGTSAQCVAPAGGLSLSDLCDTTEALLHAGIPIDEVNTVRKHLSELKGGHLAHRVSPATLVSLIVIDEVAGEAWGPTVGDETTFQEAIEVLRRYDLEDSVPKSVVEHLKRGRASEIAETPRPSQVESLDTLEIVLADSVDLCEAARDRTEELGYNAMILSTSIEGESAAVARVIAAIADEILTFGRPIDPPCVVVTGGETTVRVSTDAGEGGPNQEFGLAFALESADRPGVTALSLGTDGTDGPTEVAGALVDGSTVPRIRDAGADPREYLQRHDSSRALRLVDDAVVTGATGTNVMDLRLILIEN